jgi:hypothetical protein
MVKKAGETEVLRCSFCNKDQNDVRKLIAGPTVFICDECVEVCNDIIADDNRFDNRGVRSSLPTPQEIKKFLDEYVIGQERTKRKLAVAVGFSNFPQVPPDPIQLAAYQWAIDWLTDIDPYAGLLINRHRTGLWRARYGALRYPEAFNAKGLNEMAEKFISNNEQRQKSEMPGFDEKEFLTNYQLLQVWDLLSLYFCVRPVKEDYIDPVPTRYAEGPGSGVRMDVRPLDATNMVRGQFRGYRDEPGVAADSTGNG